MKMRVLGVLLLVSAVAGAQPTDPVVKIREQQQVLAQELQTGVLKLTPREVALVRKDQTVVRSVLEGRNSLDELNVAERVTLDNALERINARVVATRQAEEDADVCRYERVTGSKMRKLDCATAAERQNAREGGRAYLEKPRICIPPGCGQ